MKETIKQKLITLVERFEEVEHLLSDADVISNQNQFRDLSKEYARLHPVTKDFTEYIQILDDIGAAEELRSSDDPEDRALGQEELEILTGRIERQEDALMLHLIPIDPDDNANLYLEIRAGTGGDEAALFAGDLFRMYKRYAENNKWKVEVLSLSEGDHGGYKEIISRVVGNGAYAKLKFESGAHRVQRVPQTESQGRVHTSACTVAILPEPEDVEDVNIDTSDLRVDTYRASGAGGQHVNKTDSAIRITHLPTGIVVQCQNERSQHKNKASALKVLKARLYQLEVEKGKEEMKNLEETKMDIGWGSQIRSYVFHPYNLVKDHRTKKETGNVSSVMDGELDGFIHAYLLNQLNQNSDL